MNQPIMLETYDVSSLDRYDNLNQHPDELEEPLLASESRQCINLTRGESHQGHPVRRRNVDGSSIVRPSHLFSGLKLYIAIVILISCCCTITAAADTTTVFPAQVTNPLVDAPEDLRLALAHLAESGTIVVDPRPPPPPPSGGNYWQIENVEKEGLLKLVRRDSNSSSTASPSKSTTSTTTVASSSTASGSAPSSTGSPSPLPSPFDTSLGNNFTSQGCPDFITSFLSNATFKACLPFSLLLESSQSFFEVEKSITRVTQTLDYTCKANLTTCDALMSALAANLTSPLNCGPDYTAQNPTVMQAHMGLIAYKPLYTASCLKNPSTSSYCFADAVTNASSPTDSYVYYLALNASLPGGSQPTCNACLQNTMAVFDAAAANRSQPVANTYIAAAQQINVQCGPAFVNASLPAPLSSAAVPISLAGPSSPLLALAALAACVLATVL